jgi:dTDP-4-amino-4,6-dideoxygalactose transaminase
LTPKRTLEDLARWGGRPLFCQPRQVGLPNPGNRERFLDRVNRILDQRRLTNDGPFVQQLERGIATLTGVKHCLATCNGTAALEITARALGLTGEVIVPSLTFVATAHALRWLGITPVFCDVDPATHNIDPAAVEACITPRTSAILGVHLWGRPCDVDALARVARAHGLRLFFDAAHAFACSHQGRMIGALGDAEIFSFHATKFFHTFEGGAVTTNDDELAARIARARNFGFTGYDRVDSLGINGKMSEVCAAMGVTLLEDLDSLIQANHERYRQYRHELEGLPGLEVLAFDERERGNYQYVVLDLDDAVTAIHRDRVVELLHAENVIARRYFFPGCHRMEPYGSEAGAAAPRLPHTERLAARLLALPGGASVSADDVALIADTIRLILRESSAIAVRLAAEDRVGV